MASGLPVMLSNNDDSPIKLLRPISFARTDQSSFNEELLQIIVDQTPDVLPIKDF